MTKPVVVVSLGRILADQIRVEPVEACALVQHLHAWLADGVGADGSWPTLPPLDAVGVTGFGDFQVRTPAREVAGSRSAAEAEADLGALLLRLVSSGRIELEGTAAHCVVIARRAMQAGRGPLSSGPGDEPPELTDAMAALAPPDPSAALAALYARWTRMTDPLHAPVWEAGSEAARSRIAPGPPLDSPTVGSFELRPAAAAGPSASVSTLPQHASGRRRRTRSGRRWAMAVAAMLAVIVAVTAARWSPGPRSAGGDEVARAAPPPVRDEVYTEAPVAPAPARTASNGAVRARRLLHADQAGRVPYSPSFDPRTNGLVFHAGVDSTALLEASLDADGEVGAVRTVRDDGARAYHAQVSPDGAQLAFDSDVDGSRGIYVSGRDGSSPRRVSGPGSASVPTWSPDGETLAFARAEPGRPRVWNVWTVHLPTGRMHRETNHRVGQAWGASWFPDGRRLAYSVEDRLIVLDRETGETQTWRTPVAGRLVRTPAVSPDGRRIVFQVHRDGAWVLDLERPRPERVLADRSAQEFAWAPDGERVAYHSVRGGEWGIWMMDVGR